MSTQVQKKFEISRKEASKILKVSTRTLDRYINSRKLSTKKIAGRIFLDENEVIDFKTKSRQHKSVKKARAKVRMAKEPKKDKKPNKVYDIPVEAYIEQEITNEESNNVNDEDKVYEKLFS